MSYVIPLLLFCLILSSERKIILSRRREDWILDACSLLVHFAVIPMAQVAIVYSLLSSGFPELRGSIDMNWGLALLANVLIDYGWYWNHRLLHAHTPLWALHEVHHAPQSLDAFASQRNSLWSPLFMLYFWVYPVVIYLSDNPSPFLIVSGVGLVVNFWGHTSLNFPRGSRIRRFLSLAIVQPEDHFWHHSVENGYCNFATIYNFWDKIHGTWYQPEEMPKHLGFELRLPVWRKVLFPWQI